LEERAKNADGGDAMMPKIFVSFPLRKLSLLELARLQETRIR
jgi:hypothetical protein